MTIGPTDIGFKKTCIIKYTDTLYRSTYDYICAQYATGWSHHSLDYNVLWSYFDANSVFIFKYSHLLTTIESWYYVFFSQYKAQYCDKQAHQPIMRRTLNITKIRSTNMNMYAALSMLWARAAIFGKVKKLYQKPRIRHNNSIRRQTHSNLYKKRSSIQKNNIFIQLVCECI